ncbi:hypothetical protein AALP_AAs51321U000700 [Arabis alpina]|uniref:VAN3-binding protein-like auxin canalisation domain-containing protein n=1 Tax=Arabis alpina TaxID=50452 RepID=A0A087FZP2_ARAAL|nr:hypothetical protein AALP_AAs51321U000700 [Arabis alpina]
MDHERIPYTLKEVAEEEEEEEELIEEEDDTESLTLSSAPGNEKSECLSSPATYPPIPDQPVTPRESMEFLCRSWSISTSEISLALSSKKTNKQNNKNPNLSQLVADTSPAPAPPPPPPPPLLPGKLPSVVHARRTGTIGKWFHHRELIGGGRNSAVKKRDKARMENAHLHSAISIASLATAIAAVTAFCNQDSFKESKMSSALASASELLASHCLELAELSGADHDRIVSAVRSAVDVRGPGDLLTLTAAAATGNRCSL